MKKTVIGLGFLLSVLAANTVQAQPVETLVSRDVGFFASGVNPATGGLPMQTNNYTVAQTTCGITPKGTVPGGTVVNPQRIRFDDPSNPTSADCEIGATVLGGALQSVPVGTGYRIAMRSKGATQTSVWSALSNPFAIQPVAPATPTGVRVE